VNQSPGTLRKQSYTPKGFVLRHSRPTSTEPTGNRKYVRIPGETVGRDHDSEEEESPIRRPAIGRKRLPYSNVPASSDGNLVEQDTSIPLRLVAILARWNHKIADHDLQQFDSCSS
jgi:hypothetical protein